MLRQHLYKTRLGFVETMMKPIKTISERFLEKITNSCWYWMGALNRKGYGTFFVDKNNRKVPVHRFTWEFFFGKIGYDEIIHHICRQKDCVNPDHLAKMRYHKHVQIHKSGRLSLLTIRQHLYKMERLTL